MEKTPMRMVLVPLAILATAAPLRGFQVDSDLRQRIDEVFSEYDRTNGPGCAVGLVQAGRLAYARGYGIGQMDHTVPLDETSVFYLASVSKQFTAAAVLIAEHEGYLALDDDIRTHIPEFPDYGIARQRELNFEPGSEHLYSNSGYVLLAEIVKRATGRSLREYAHQKIFQPLAMTNTHFHDDRTRIVKNRVFSYDPGPDGSWRTNYLMNFDKVGDGGLYSSVEDLARWDAAFYADLLGVPDFASRMYTRGVLSTGDTIAYARGLGVGERRGLRRVAHGGGLMAFRTMIARYPDERTTVITLCNVGSASSGRLSAAVEDAVLADRFPEPVPDQEAGRQSAREEAEEGPPIEVSDSVLALLAGEYYSPELETTWVLEVRDLGLVLHHPSGTKLALEARSDEVFEARGLELEFLSEGGEVTGFVLGAGRVRNIRFARSPG
jgi:CubicO group peptidase (beta-lactamase class C family)